MAAAPEMRASDGDRERVAAALREHMAEGRLTVDEFNERLEQVYQSRTYGELAKLTSDLPEIDLHRLPAATESVRASQPARRDDKARADLRGAWTAWAGASAVCWVIWVLTFIGSGDAGYPWPLWVMGPWGVILLIHTITGAGGQSRRDT
ncbi:hypothetical protein GCM10010116_12580 [Microbispora rosea subsp. aerata]|nr:DUF1707 domain-containing protein [Microbispora rosea]GGO06398.1 hypothetical protein GCM10010116_12580 [Microbispora rosea subsp. aerata]GIH55134.1 hypothetical protein Mro02_20480 [Microbispora rosea subsp. aerata]GLJ82584.1 hypothetical protein GCM10017588_13090 [Microbispora rosea subsp. aerata]